MRDRSVVPETENPVMVRLTAEEVQQALARVELGDKIMLAPPDEDSEEMQELRQLLPAGTGGRSTGSADAGAQTSVRTHGARAALAQR